jgi:hypothetical protein
VRLGILETVGLAASLVFAVPVGIAGGGFLLGDRPFLGGVLVVVAVLMVVVPRRVTTPGDVPGAVLGRLAGRAVEPPDAAEAGEESPDAAEAGEESPDAAEAGEESPDAAEGR